jgi:hypothetical protein
MSTDGSLDPPLKKAKQLKAGNQSIPGLLRALSAPQPIEATPFSSLGTRPPSRAYALH